ncbi:oligosaccharyl transferase, archaeosortase A system-associated [Haloarcula halophila]|uniref:oligosaccharyl transferase, archaeosortase A system-associated n=1 Tax=Haloarcula TaxID=2237 RepID=UPI0023E4282D|nr:oligosaccharyl transferase, archaeosortase A system-associated [Halomicroarcula sp. DFY41]
MSQWRGQFEDNPELEAALDKVERWYHVPVLLALLGFMLWNRVRSWQNFIVDGEVLFSGNDPWYHYRTTVYTVRNWPGTMPFDPWTQFPIGSSPGQFGTLFDQVAATLALIVGLGSPSESTIAMVALFFPAVLGTLAAIPMYVMGRRLAGRLGGVTAVLVLALSAGAFLGRSLVGTFDHHVAEAFLQTTAVLGMMVAISAANRDKPVFEQFVDRDIDALRSTVLWSVLSGFAVATYLWTWPPGVLLIGILGTFFLLRLIIEFVRGQSPEHTAIVGTIALATTGVLTLVSLDTLTVSATRHSLLQPGLAFAVAGGCAFMAWLARYFDRESLDTTLYPVTVFGIIGVLAAVAAVVTPDLFSFFVDNVLRVIGFSVSPTAGTVGEAQPYNPNDLYPQYGLTVFIAAIGVVAIVAEQFLASDPDGEELLVAIWGVFLLAATFTQGRFAYYLIFPVGAITGLLVGRLVSWVDLSGDGDIAPYEVLTVISLLVVVVAPLLVVAPTPMDYGSSAGPGQGIENWDDSLQWMEGNTPAVGAYDTGDEQSLDYYGTYKNREDFDYQTGDYGVLSWWDYGHWITTRAERIPNANPFQQGTDVAANFLLAQNESEADEVLETYDEDDARTEYVAVDWKMTQVKAGTGYGGKFFAPPQFDDDSNQSDYYRPIVAGNGNFFFHYRTQDYYNSTVVRLYEYHGSAVNAQPIVVDWERSTANGQSRRVPAETPIRTFSNMSAAENYVQQDGTAQVGGVGTVPSQRVPALKHYRYVGSSDRTAYESSEHNRAILTEAQGLRLPVQPASDTCGANQTSAPIGGSNYCTPDQIANLMHQNSPTWTKIFERVPGGTIEGTGPANTVVQVSVPMRNTQTDETFTYRQTVQTDENGNFETTVPYSTTGYDEYGPADGHTNVSVRAEGPYQFRAVTLQNRTVVRSTGTTHVTEGQVIGENETASTVELTRQQPQDASTGSLSPGAVPAEN